MGVVRGVCVGGCTTGVCTGVCVCVSGCVGAIAPLECQKIMVLKNNKKESQQPLFSHMFMWRPHFSHMSKNNVFPLESSAASER